MEDFFFIYVYLNDKPVLVAQFTLKEILAMNNIVLINTNSLDLFNDKCILMDFIIDQKNKNMTLLFKN